MVGRLRLYALCGFLYFYQHDRASRRDSLRALYGNFGFGADLFKLLRFAPPINAKLVLRFIFIRWRASAFDIGRAI